MTEDTRPVGRPSLYDPSYCDKVVELGALGKSVEQISSNLGVSLRTMYTWRDAYPEFLHALDEAKAAEQTWCTFLNSSQLSTRVVLFSLKAKARS